VKLKRREALVSLLGAAGALGPARGLPQDVSEETVKEMLRLLAGVEPMVGEAAAVRAFLLTFRAPLRPDPEIEPAIEFDPEVDP
jgi:hypothetical protein